MRVALLRCEQGAGLACRLGRCFKAFHALRSPPETRTPLRCESRYSHNVNGVTTMCGHAVSLFYCLTNTPLKRGAVFCAARQIHALPLGRVAERGEVGRGFPLFFLLFSASGRPKTSSASPSGCRKKPLHKPEKVLQKSAGCAILFLTARAAENALGGECG